MNETLEIIKSVLSEYGKCGEQIALAGIVEEPKGSEQTSDVPGVETEHVEQFGDEAGGVPYYGNIYVSLAPGVWGRFEYHT